MPGTTRDAVDTIVETEDGPLRFVDTAGMRRRSKIDEPTEYYSLVRALQAVDRADAALLVVDAHEGVSHQDQRLAERVDAAGTAIVIILNKWDLLDAEGRAQAKIDVADRLAFLSYAPVLTVSALTGRMMQQVLPALRQAEEAYHTRVPTAALNRVIREAQRAPAAGGTQAPAPGPLRHPGRSRPAHVHAVRLPRAPADVPAVPGAQDPRVLRPRTHSDQAPRAPPQRLTPSWLPGRFFRFPDQGNSA